MDLFFLFKTSELILLFLGRQFLYQLSMLNILKVIFTKCRFITTGFTYCFIPILIETIRILCFFL